jgi:LysM repeat protein
MFTIDNPQFIFQGGLRMSEERIEVVRETSSRGEWFRFGALVVILGIVVLGIALLRPLIFDRIVPAVLGEGLQPTPVVQPAQVAPTEAAAPVEETPVATAEPAETADTPSADEPADTETAEPAESEPTAVATIQHIVRPGENLTTIARAYNVTVQAIITANNISNPNRIDAGTVLLIPQQ